MNITTKFSIGSRAYYIIFATTSINPVDVMNVWIDNGTIYYKVNKSGTDIYLGRIPESDLLTFSEAKSRLLTHLNNQIAIINALVAP